MRKYSYLAPLLLQVFARHGRIGVLSLLYLRRRLDEEGLYPNQVGDTTILRLITSRQNAWYKSMRWTAGPDDWKLHSPDGVKTWLDGDIRHFKRICAGDADPQLTITHAYGAMKLSNRLPANEEAPA